MNFNNDIDYNNHVTELIDQASNINTNAEADVVINEGIISSLDVNVGSNEFARLTSLDSNDAIAGAYNQAFDGNDTIREYNQVKDLCTNESPDTPISPMSSLLSSLENSSDFSKEDSANEKSLSQVNNKLITDKTLKFDRDFSEKAVYDSMEIYAKHDVYLPLSHYHNHIMISSLEHCIVGLLDNTDVLLPKCKVLSVPDSLSTLHFYLPGCYYEKLYGSMCAFLNGNVRFSLSKYYKCDESHVGDKYYMRYLLSYIGCPNNKVREFLYVGLIASSKFLQEKRSFFVGCVNSSLSRLQCQHGSVCKSVMWNPTNCKKAM